VGKLKERNYIKDASIGERIVKKYGRNLWSGFIWLRIGATAGCFV
jgi:hypothetical protein